jgi:hypothetical protein
VKAEGSVYIINQNGIIFGGASQINVGSLIASSLPFFGEDITNPASITASNQAFVSEGITGASQLLGTGGTIFLRAGDPPVKLPGDIAIEAGAHIETGESGFSLIAAPNVTNGGTVIANGGQAMLAAGMGFTLTGTGLALAPVPTGAIVDLTGAQGVDITPHFTLTNIGLVAAMRGNAALLGADVAQNGWYWRPPALRAPAAS